MTLSNRETARKVYNTAWLLIHENPIHVLVDMPDIPGNYIHSVQKTAHEENVTRKKDANHFRASISQDCNLTSLVTVSPDCMIL